MENVNVKTRGHPAVTDAAGKQDHEVIRQVLEGDTNSFRLLVERYQGPVFNLLLRMMQNGDEAAELTQETFVKAYEALPDFRFGFRFFSWLYRIAINLALNELKKRKPTTGLDGITELPEEENDNSRERLVNMALGRIDDRYRMLIVMKYYRQMSYRDMAAVLNISEQKVKSRLYDARMQLKGILEKTDFFTSK